MAITFELWAQCSTSIERDAFAHHFAGVDHTLLSGRRVTWRADAQAGDAPAVSIWSPDLPNKGVRTVIHAVELTEAGLRLYSHLRSAPEFLSLARHSKRSAFHWKSFLTTSFHTAQEFA